MSNLLQPLREKWRRHRVIVGVRFVKGPWLISKGVSHSLTTPFRLSLGGIHPIVLRLELNFGKDLVSENKFPLVVLLRLWWNKCSMKQVISIISRHNYPSTHINIHNTVSGERQSDGLVSPSLAWDLWEWVVLLICLNIPNYLPATE